MDIEVTQLEPLFDFEPPWQLPMVGYAVEAIEFYGGLLYVYAYGGEPRARTSLQLSGPFRLVGAGASTDFNTEGAWRDLAPILELRHERIVQAVVAANSALTIQFESGRALESAPDGSPYETWEITAPDFNVVGLPSGPRAWSSAR